MDTREALGKILVPCQASQATLRMKVRPCSSIPTSMRSITGLLSEVVSGEGGRSSSIPFADSSFSMSCSSFNYLASLSTSRLTLRSASAIPVLDSLSVPT